MAETTQNNIIVVNQIYQEYLNIIFKKRYYEKLYARTIGYAKVYDYVIGLGSAASGGTGLGILAAPEFAWACGALTTGSIFLSVAKGIWDWAGKSKFSLDRVQFYDKLCSDYASLVDDLNAERNWNNDFAERRKALRQNGNPTSPDPYPQLKTKIQNQIQLDIQAQLSYKRWWEWQDVG